jgi:transcriptional regulator of acetoin/glycerol metabolism
LVPPKSPVIPVPRNENRVPSLAESKEQAIRAALAAAGGVKRAAEILGIGRTTLYRKMKQYGIE